MKTNFFYTNLLSLLILCTVGQATLHANCPELMRGPYLLPGSGVQASESIIVRWRLDMNAGDMEICFSPLGQNTFNTCRTIEEEVQNVVIPHKFGGNEYISTDNVYNYQYEVDFSETPFNDGNTYEYRIYHESEICNSASIVDDDDIIGGGIAGGVLRPYPIKGAGLEETLNIWVLGDPGDAKLEGVRDAYNIYKNAQNYEDDFILLLGDNAYGYYDEEEGDDPSKCNTGCASDGSDYAYGQAIFAADKLQEEIKDQVMWTTIGNHEVNHEFNNQSHGSGEPNIEEFFEIFSYIPPNKAYYSHDYGEAHFICLNSEIIDDLFGADEINNLETMTTWLRNDLQNSTAKWNIVYFHHPVHTASLKIERNTLDDEELQADMEAMVDSILPVLYEYNVDLVMTGHTHHYERSFLVHDQDDSTVDNYCEQEGYVRPASIIHDGSSTNDYLDDYLDNVHNYDCDNFDESVFPKSEDGTVFVVLGSSSKLNNPKCDQRLCYFDHPIMRPMENPEIIEKYNNNNNTLECEIKDRGRGLLETGSGRLSIQGNQLTFEFVVPVYDGSNVIDYEVKDKFTIDKSYQVECVPNKIYNIFNNDIPEETHAEDWIKMIGVTVNSGENVIVQAGDYIELKPQGSSFATNIKYGASFEAYIAPCEAGSGKKESVENVAEPKLKVYPNPFSDIFNIEYSTDKETDVTIAIYNLSGQLEKVVTDQERHPIGSHNIEVDAQSLREGIYIVQILTEDAQLTQKLVKL